jgi:hypothetical protein
LLMGFLFSVGVEKRLGDGPGRILEGFLERS